MNRVLEGACVAALAAALLSGCEQRAPVGDALFDAERELRRELRETNIELAGRLVGPGGAPVDGAVVKVQGQSATTGADGVFRVRGLRRENAAVELSAPGYRPEVFAVELRRPVAEATVTMEDQRLSPQDGASARLLFTGDFSLGRRLMDPDDATPRGELPSDTSKAIISVGHPQQGAIKTVSFLKPLFGTADYRLVNLESPVTSDPVTPHTSKPFAFFTLPGSLEALRFLGVDYVALGNNHVYDYLEAGLRDTLSNVDAAGLRRSGAGMNASEAFVPRRDVVGRTPYSFVSACSISGEEYSVDFVAHEDKGGAADLRDVARMTAVVQSEAAAGQLPIALFHGGFEYADRPSNNVREYFELGAKAGAVLGIGHHPHTPQGFGRTSTGMPVAYSLGNFVFDQDRVETMIGMFAEAELAGAQLRSLRAAPVYLEDYRPRMIAGTLADTMARRVGELSAENGVTVLPRNGRMVVLPADTQPVVVERVIEVEAPVGDSGWGVADLRGVLQPGESVAAATVASGSASTLVPGYDLLRFGDFEDHDVDLDQGEVSRWDVEDPGVFACLYGARTGVSGLCFVPSPYTERYSAVLRNRVRAPQDGDEPPNRQLTVVGWMKGEDASFVTVNARFLAPEGERTFGEQRLYEHKSGDFDWTFFQAEVAFPAEPAGADDFTAPRALRLDLRLSSGERTEGVLMMDDLAIVAWEGRLSGTALQLPTPNANDFVRVAGAPGTSVRLHVVARRYELPPQ